MQLLVIDGDLPTGGSPVRVDILLFICDVQLTYSSTKGTFQKSLYDVQTALESEGAISPLRLLFLPYSFLQGYIV